METKERFNNGPKLHITQSDLMCKTGCGYFGNIAWQGYCSKCYKEYFLHKQHYSQANSMSPKERKVRRSVSDVGSLFSTNDVGSSATLPRPGFTRFEEKKRHNKEVKSTAVKSLFRKTPTKTGSPSTRERRTLSPDSHASTQELGQFLQHLPASAAHHAYTVLKLNVDKLNRLVAAGISPMDISEKVHDMYQGFADKLKEHTAFSELTTEQVDQLLDHSERYLTSVLYRKLFCPPNWDDEERDLAIQKRIRGLNWISAPLLDCRINELDPQVREILEKAITHLIEVDGKRAPQDKLNCIIACSKLVFEMLRLSNTLKDSSDMSEESNNTILESSSVESNSNPASADDFLPALIYTVLRANPPRIHSNLNFINRFASPVRLLQGEGGYYFTNLCCAVSFLENLTSDSLGLTREDFDRYMSGKAIPFTSLQAGILVSEGLRLMYQNMSTLSELRQKQQQLQQHIEQLKTEMEDFNEAILKEVADGLERYPITIRGRRAPVKPDEEQPDDTNVLKLLPPPLSPEKVGGSVGTSELEVTGSLENFEPISSTTKDLMTEERGCNEMSGGISLSIEDFDSFTCGENQISTESVADLRNTPTPLSLRVQGRVIPCIPCETDNPSNG